MAATQKKVIVIDSKSVFTKILEDAGSKHVLVEFFATWCGPCAMIGPRLEQLANEYSTRLIILKIDVDENEELALQYDVTGMPTFVIIKNGVTLIQFVGSNPEKIVSVVEKYVGKVEDNKPGKPSSATGTASVSAPAANRGSSN
ncbi:thioredoxin-2 [Drosophila kikkawai]|uniref:Thioredoxin-2 n=1 Tax=Drosophila kikkawai TaxID=30033 RepID=A0A6P4IAB7_DROKI|nr:thioredoxin-2 [Drosophila kikkawai]